MSDFYKKFTQSVLIAGGIIASALSIWADSFTVANGETLTSTQTLLDGETGLIESGGFLDLTAGITSPILIDASVSTSITITNNGTITSVQRAIDDRGSNTGVIATIIKMARLPQSVKQGLLTL